MGQRGISPEGKRHKGVGLTKGFGATSTIYDSSCTTLPTRPGRGSREAETISYFYPGIEETATPATQSRAAVNEKLEQEAGDRNGLSMQA